MLLGLHYISHNPDKARAQLVQSPWAFLKAPLGLITKATFNFAKLLLAYQLEDKFGKPELNPSPKLKSPSSA